MHLAAGFLREHAEQQRLGQSGFCVLRPHLVAQVLVVFPGAHQVRAILRQPLLDRHLHRIVHGDDVAELVALEQRDRTPGLRQRGHHRGRFAGFRGRVRRFVGAVCRTGSRIGRRAQQLVERGKESRRVAAARGCALRRRRLQIVQRRIGLVRRIARLARGEVVAGVGIQPRVQSRHRAIRCHCRLTRRLSRAGDEQQTRNNDGTLAAHDRHSSRFRARYPA